MRQELIELFKEKDKLSLKEIEQCLHVQNTEQIKEMMTAL